LVDPDLAKGQIFPEFRRDSPPRRRQRPDHRHQCRQALDSPESAKLFKLTIGELTLACVTLGGAKDAAKVDPAGGGHAGIGG
jgi:hypothetical protein